MRISERADNAVHAMGVLAAAGDHVDGRPTALKADEIAAVQAMSATYLLDILRDVHRAELVGAERGPDGGFTRSRPAAEISLAEILPAVDGPLVDVDVESLRSLTYAEPVAGLPTVWMAVRGSLRRVLETVTAERPGG